MSAETVLNSTLLASAAVTGLVGAGSAARIYPDNVPQEQATPCIAYSRQSTEFLYTISGNVAGEKATMEVWCMAETRQAAESLADAAAGATLGIGGFVLIGRRAEFDNEAALWGAVLTLDVWT